MAKPTTKQELIDHCLRKLGAPVLEINVSDEQLDDIIDDAVQCFNERHFDGVEQTYLKYNCQHNWITDSVDSMKGYKQGIIIKYCEKCELSA